MSNPLRRRDLSVKEVSALIKRNLFCVISTHFISLSSALLLLKRFTVPFEEQTEDWNDL